ncbi:terminase large subunit [Loigolactobacillus bifermentans]|uniref:Putative terminase, large subunit n=1 Tax=Loigolactobacillus bifermentans DSM 20003 TaxID=1423726 RepID=A0A0R1GXV8_9LACO|nr:terminase TerL endonuclease subunit [Loigolactobacillus bifermentans]KRK38990.1 putative terminase, large subunit [Loigolactobacillus bifermentans DSM 20003]QGG59126.1 terminase large subunit [Loigolactobacillus bifermentans]
MEIDAETNYAEIYAKLVRRYPKRYPMTIRKAVKRYFKWKKRKDIWWDNYKANEALDFMQTFVRHVKGTLAGKLLELEPWEMFGFAQLYGWQHHNDKGETCRVISEVYWQVPKKNGKTLIGTGALAYAMYGDDELGANVYCCASDFDQAQYAAGPFALTIQNSEELYANTQIFKGKGGSVTGAAYRYDLEGINYINEFKVMTKNTGKIEGSNPSFVLNDELHTQKNMEQYDNFKSAMADRLQPIMFNISTAGKGSSSVGMRVYKESKAILEQDNDDSRLVLIYEPNRGYDYADRKVWKMVNPNIGISVTMEFLEKEFKSAERSEHGKGEFLSKHLDVFVNGADNYFTRDQVEPILQPGKMGDLSHMPCWLGVDLSKTTDLTCISLNFPTQMEDGRAMLKVKQRYFLPFENVDFREQEDNVPYRQLAEQGFVEFCEGRMIDQDQVLEYVRGLMEEYEIQGINYDPAMAQHLVEMFENLGLECVEVRQYPTVLNDVVRDTERLMYEKRLITDNPLLVYCLLNVVAIENINGMIAPSKRQSTHKIDGAAAFFDAHKSTVDQMSDVTADEMNDYVNDLYK